jgi:hypothetical protein
VRCGALIGGNGMGFFAGCSEILDPSPRLTGHDPV